MSNKLKTRHSEAGGLYIDRNRNLLTGDGAREVAEVKQQRVHAMKGQGAPKAGGPRMRAG